MSKLLNSILSCLSLTLSISACASSTSVNELFKNRLNLAGTDVVVEGVLINQNSTFNLCDSSAAENCVILEYKKDLKVELKSNLGNRLLINGTFLDHDYVEAESGLRFVPSRLSISSVKLVEN